MSFDGLRVNHAGLDAAAQDLHSTVAEIGGRLDSLESELNVLRTDWVGDAQRAYTTAKARWDTAIREMRDLLEQTSRTVHQSNAEYGAADRRGASSFGG